MALMWLSYKVVSADSPYHDLHHSDITASPFFSRVFSLDILTFSTGDVKPKTRWILGLMGVRPNNQMSQSDPKQKHQGGA